MHPDTMKRLGLKRGEHVALKTPGGTLETAAYDYIGIRPDVFAIGTGQGHTSPGSRWWKRGANAFATLPATFDEASGALAILSQKGSLTKTGRKYYLSYLGGDPYTGGQSRQMGRGIAQAIPLTAIKGDGHGAAPAAGHGEGGGHEGGHDERAMHLPGYVGSPVPGDPIAHAAKERPNSAYAKHANHKWAMVIDLN